MALESSDGQVRITFQYTGEPQQPGRTTRVVLVVSSNGDTVSGEGYAVCGKRDNFSREIGRRIALGRALKHLQVTDDTARAVWHVYRERTHVRRST